MSKRKFKNLRKFNDGKNNNIDKNHSNANSVKNVDTSDNVENKKFNNQKRLSKFNIKNTDIKENEENQNYNADEISNKSISKPKEILNDDFKTKPKNTANNIVKSKKYFNRTKDKLKGKNDFKDNLVNDTKHKKTHSKLNFDEDEKVTRTKDKKTKSETRLDKKLKFEEKKISKLKKDSEKIEKKLNSKKTRKSDVIKDKAHSSAITTSVVAASYLESGKDENSAVDASYKTLNSVENSSRALKSKSYNRKKKQHKKMTKLNNKIDKKERDVFYKKNLADFKKSEEFKKSNSTKKFFKKKRYKKEMQKKYKNSVKHKFKKFTKDTGKKIAQYIKSKHKKILMILLPIIILIYLLSNLGNTLVNMATGVVSNTVSTSYLSDVNVLKDVNNDLSKLENELQSEIDNVKENYPDYDEYIIIKNGKIGHNVHELLSYITSRYGVVSNSSEVSDLVTEIFDRMYDLEYKSVTETRYRWVTSTYTDAEGNTHTSRHRESYEWKKLIVTLNTRSMDSIVREIFADYPDNLKHYEALFLAQGNMAKAFGNSELIALNGGIGGGAEYEASAEIQKKIVNAAYITPSPGAGWCAMWVSQVYQNAGLGYLGGNACDMYRNFTFTSDKSKLEVGMLVAVESSSSGTNAGLIYGHVGIYIGDGKVMDNIGRVRITTLDNWIASFCQHHPVGFGFPPVVEK